MSVVSLGDAYFVTALRSVGIEGKTVRSAMEAEEAVEFLTKGGNCKAIVVTEKLAFMLERKRSELARRGLNYPVLIVVPEMEGGVSDRTRRLYKLVSEAVGAGLRLED
jgi:vacuolar-type H+-ATPase subunit F/Vma7